MQGHPIHLWDALSGELRASYRVYNAADEVTAACSIAFDRQGQRLFAGLNNRLCIFDVARPGRYCKNIVPHSRASPGLQGVALMRLNRISLREVSLQAALQWVTLLLHGSKCPQGCQALYCRIFGKHQRLQWGKSTSLFLPQASYRAWLATQTDQPCWLLDPIWATLASLRRTLETSCTCCKVSEAASLR